MRPLDVELEKRINPERSRLFLPEQFERNRAFLEEVARRWPALGDDPAHDLPGVLRPALRIAVVGSNGKGSTAYYLARLFQLGLSEKSAPRVGLYTSPHLLDVCERIRLDGESVDAAAILASIQELSQYEKADQRFSYFEVLTLAALLIFSRRRPEVEIYEAGLGGRLDATRAARARIVLLTDIALEHVALLGSSPEQILREKLGICTESAEQLFVMPQSALSERDVQTATRQVCPHVRVIFAPAADSGFSGEHNATYLHRSLAFARFCYRAIAPGSATEVSVWPGPAGRLEVRRAQNRLFCYDTAHNSTALATTVGSLPAVGGFPGPGESAVLFGCLSDRDPALFWRVLRESGFERVTQVIGPGFAPAPSGESAIPTERLAEALRASEADFVLCTGTHRLYKEFAEAADTA